VGVSADSRPLVSDTEVEAVFSRYVTEAIPRDSPRYAEEIERQAQKLSRASVRVRPSPWLGREKRRAVAHVDAQYSKLWSRLSLDQELSSPKTTWFEWRDAAMNARTVGRKHLHQLLLLRALDRLEPRSVLEVGFGYGFNLLLLAMQRPRLALHGVELTSAGVDAARQLAADPGTRGMLAPFAVDEVRQDAAIDASAFCQGSAEALPFASKAVDVAFTVLALEQMEQIRDAALRELCRVARRHVVMIEPFREWNADGIRRRYIEIRHYFDAATSDLPRYGLKPIVASADFPNKVTFHAGLVVAEVLP
jgi:ubiquinone/menaquinone biosynthesis C-methylase UbiE